MKDRIGIYSAGFNPESVFGLLLPFVVVGMLTVIGYMLVKVLNP
ncbi:MAG TPA: hypothetical protein VMM78_08790 [Thermomicrobiales bacterium]|nr:hypothetical protein [Thermomicrobiales bacterium]